jgi:hypothetical protein
MFFDDEDKSAVDGGVANIPTDDTKEEEKDTEGGTSGEVM